MHKQKCGRRTLARISTQITSCMWSRGAGFDRWEGSREERTPALEPSKFIECFVSRLWNQLDCFPRGPHLPAVTELSVIYIFNKLYSSTSADHLTHFFCLGNTYSFLKVKLKCYLFCKAFPNFPSAIVQAK